MPVSWSEFQEEDVKSCFDLSYTKFYVSSNQFFFLSCPSRDKDYHLRTYKSVVMANKLIDWLIAQVSPQHCFLHRVILNGPYWCPSILETHLGPSGITGVERRCKEEKKERGEVAAVITGGPLQICSRGKRLRQQSAASRHQTRGSPWSKKETEIQN